MVINTNIAAINAARLLEQSTDSLNSSLARLSSGSKIVNASDDPAGTAVSMRFNAQISRTEAASNNVSSAVSFNQTQDGFLQNVGDALNRMSELAMLAQDTTKSDSDRALYNKEFSTLGSYIDNISTKEFNGVSLFNGNTLAVTVDSEGNTFGMTQGTVQVLLLIDMLIFQRRIGTVLQRIREFNCNLVTYMLLFR